MSTMTNKAIITNRIYLKAKNTSHEEAIVHGLTYRIEDKFRSQKGKNPVYEVTKTFIRYPGKHFSIPVGRIDLIPEEYEIQDDRILVPAAFPKPKFELRPSQKAIYDHIEDSAIINAPVSWGKTFAALYIASKFKQKTLIITHTTILRDQWIKEVEKLYGFTPGIIGGGKLIDLDMPIVIANVQTLVKYIPQFVNTFGLVVLDEMHHVPATSFSNIIDSLNSRYRIGLSGTVLRKDGKHIMFPDYFGRVVYKPDIENSMEPKIVLVNVPITLPTGKHWADRITALNDLDSYRDVVVHLAGIMADKGHRVLVVGDRVNFLNSCARRSGDRAVAITGLVTKFGEREALMNKISNAEADILYGTRSIFSEGVSLDELSCLIMASVINSNISLEQLIGRIRRVAPGKLNPVVLDLQLQGSTTKRQARDRQFFYLQSNWKVYSLEKF